MMICVFFYYSTLLAATRHAFGANETAVGGCWGVQMDLFCSRGNLDQDALFRIAASLPQQAADGG